MKKVKYIKKIRENISEIYTKLKEYTLLATHFNHVPSIYQLAIKENDNKYFLMGIKENHSESMNSYAQRLYIAKDYENAKKYYLMAIKTDKNNSNALYNLGYYYRCTENNYKEMKNIF